MLPTTIAKLKNAVRPANWDTLKTEAIELQSDSYWVDDNPFQAEIACLRVNRVHDRLIFVDLRHPNELLTVQEKFIVLMRKRVNHSLTSFAAHLTEQYGEPGTMARKEFEDGFKVFKRKATR